jgi:hypothetical protein
MTEADADRIKADLERFRKHQGTCPHHRAFPNTRLLEDEGETVICCPDCRGVKLEISDIWIPRQPGIIDVLRELIKPAQASIDRDRDAMFSRSDDPRWERSLL